eukprot:COSAG01_NODE_56872_length_315_cov_8.115741_1_plen_88_part_01
MPPGPGAVLNREKATGCHNKLCDCECLSRISANSGASYGSQSRAWLPGHCIGREIFDALLETFLVASLGGPIVVPPSDPREGVIGPYI